jgi:hypothetical protein
VNHRNFERILRLWVTTSTSVSGTVPKNLNPSLTLTEERGGRDWRMSVMGGLPDTFLSRKRGEREREMSRRSKNKGAVELEPKGLIDGKP